MSRIIEQAMVRAISYEEEWRKDNTEVSVIHHGIHGTPSYQKEIQVRLHGNLIARIYPFHKVVISTCGWKTKTTKSRINAILHHYNKPGIYQKDYIWYIGDKEFQDGMEVSIR